MFICIKHGDNQQFLANTNCPLILLLQYLKHKLELPKTDLIDLCDEKGILKLLFLYPTPLESASRMLYTRGTYIVCRVNLKTLEFFLVSYCSSDLIVVALSLGWLLLHCTVREEWAGGVFTPQSW
ncbi:UNVERIFIED_CONTAM: hypothetical protein FKN15_005240 [Acipenser sinensis]